MTRPDTAALAGPPAGIVDVWCVPLRLPALARDRLARLLSVEERTQVARMRVGGEAWSAAHAALRLILAHYLGTPPEGLRLERGRLGKPRLASGHGPYFNLSRREELALVAVASDREVGVDLERQDDATRIERLARDFLSPVECAAVERAGGDRRRTAFFAAWTRHEARRKLHGVALEDPAPNLKAGTMVLVRGLEMPAGYAAAIAAEGGAWRVRRREVAEAL